MENEVRNMLLDSEINLDVYYELIKNLTINDKIKLISKISNSIIEKEIKENELDIISCFGAFDSEKTAEEIIEELYKSRNFSKKDIEL